MTFEVLLTCATIVVARIVDVSLGTFRTIAVVNGRRALAFAIGFFEVLIWVFVVRVVIHQLDNPLYAVSYAGGFALGTFIGITLEGRIGTGKQVLRAFSRKGEEIAAELRTEGYVVTCFEGSGREGPIQLVFVEGSRRAIRHAVDVVHLADPGCFYVLDDVRLSSERRAGWRSGFDWRRISKRK